jgi:hypothetical protein
MTDRTDVAELLAQPGPWTSAYIDGHGDQPTGTEESRQRSVREHLREAGAPEADVEAVADALAASTGVPSPSARCVLVRAGRIEVDESFADARRGPERFHHGPIPEVLPLLRHRETALAYLVVEAGREGAEIRLERAGRRAPDEEMEVEGDTGRLAKVKAGNMSQARIQRRAENVWMHNMAEVADAVDRLVRDHRPSFVVLAGDVRARQLLRERLAPASSELVVDVDAHTRAPGADDDALEETIAASVNSRLRERISAAEDRAAADGGSRGARGTSAVLAALQQAQVDELLLDAQLMDSGQELEILDAPPWLAEGSGFAGEASSLGPVPAAEALARAALVTGASVLVVEEDEPDPGEERDERPTREPVAVLRWPKDESAPE